MTDDAKPDDTSVPPPTVVVVPPPLPPAPASPDSGLGAQDARVLDLAVGGALTMFLASSPQAAIAATAIIPAFGVIAVWLYGRWLKRKQNKTIMTLHSLLRDVTGGWIQ